MIKLNLQHLLYHYNFVILKYSLNLNNEKYINGSAAYKIKLI